MILNYSTMFWILLAKEAALGWQELDAKLCDVALDGQKSEVFFKCIESQKGPP